MTLKEYRSHFKTKLRSLYPEEEIGSFFYIVTEKFLNLKRVEVALELQKKITSEEITSFENALHQLEREVPIQYIIGETLFFGLTFKVNSSVLIPRPETEELVDWIVNDYTENDAPLTILDIGTGSGCIAISLAANLPNSKVNALDISAKALTVAKQNAILNKVSVSFLEQDILAIEHLDMSYDIIVSNPPYVLVSEKQKMHTNVLFYEPHKALFVLDSNPLLFYKSIAEIAYKSLKLNGNLYFEINEAFGTEIVLMLQKLGFENVELKKDFFGKDRMVKASKLK